MTAMGRILNIHIKYAANLCCILCGEYAYSSFKIQFKLPQIDMFLFLYVNQLFATN